MVQDTEEFGGMLAYLEAEAVVTKEMNGEAKITSADLKDKSSRGKTKLTAKKDKMMRDHQHTMAGAHADLAKKFPMEFGGQRPRMPASPRYPTRKR